MATQPRGAVRNPRVERLAPLAVIAGSTCADEVVPGVLATFVARDHVVQCQIASPDAAVLTHVAVANENFLPAQARSWTRTAD